MDEMRLRGFVSPEDFTGSDTERVQNAVDTAVNKDIRKVILNGDYTVDKTVILPEQIHIVINGKISASGDFPLFVNANFFADDFHHSYTFQEDMFFIEGKGEINGNIFFYNAYRVVLQNLTVNGGLSFEFSNEVRLENMKIKGGAVNLMRGCRNFIIGYLNIEAAGHGIGLNTADTGNAYVVGKDVSIDEIIIKNCDIKAPVGISLEADEKGRIFNTVIEDNTVSGTGLTVSKKSGKLDPEHYRDITAVGFVSPKEKPIECFSETKHCYFA